LKRGKINLLEKPLFGLEVSELKEEDMPMFLF
jgi:hypothetical protein